MYLYPNRHAPSGAGMLKRNRTICFCPIFNQIVYESVFSHGSPRITVSFAGRGIHCQELDKVTVTFNVKKASLKEVFRKIEKQTTFYFTYFSEQIKKSGPVTYTRDKITVAHGSRKYYQTTGLHLNSLKRTFLLNARISC